MTPGSNWPSWPLAANGVWTLDITSAAPPSVSSSDDFFSSAWLSTSSLDSSPSTTAEMTSLDPGHSGRDGPLLTALQLALAIVGGVANSATLFAVITRGTAFQTVFRCLVAHQAFVDMLVCFTGIVLLFDPIKWTEVHTCFYLVNCYIWHAKTPYWYFTYLSTFNLVGIAVERYTAVCNPFKYKRLCHVQIRRMIICMYVVSTISIVPNLIRARYEHGPCDKQILVRPVLLFNELYSLYIFLVGYLIPVVAFCALYGCVCRTLAKRGRGQTCNAGVVGVVPSVIGSAQRRLTATSILLTLIFIAAIGMHFTCYALGSAKIVDYTNNSPLQKIGVTFSLVNSLVNPFVYGALMPSFRKVIRITFCRCTRQNDGVTPIVSEASAEFRKFSFRHSSNGHCTGNGNCRRRGSCGVNCNGSRSGTSPSERCNRERRRTGSSCGVTGFTGCRLSEKRGAGCGVGGVCGVVCGRAIHECLDEGEYSIDRGGVVRNTDHCKADSSHAQDQVATVSASCNCPDSIDGRYEVEPVNQEHFLGISPTDNIYDVSSGSESMCDSHLCNNPNAEGTTVGDGKSENIISDNSSGNSDGSQLSREVDLKRGCSFTSTRDFQQTGGTLNNDFIDELPPSEEKISTIERLGSFSSSFSSPSQIDHGVYRASRMCSGYTCKQTLIEPGISADCIKLEYLDPAIFEK